MSAPVEANPEPPAETAMDAPVERALGAPVDSAIVKIPSHAGPLLEPLLLPHLPLAEIRAAQRAWARIGIRDRLRLQRRARGIMAAHAEEIAATTPAELAGSLHRTPADTLVAEVLPLLEACRFLEREAESILKPRRSGNASRPFWLRGVSVETRREPIGVVLIIAPANYPLFLPGAQALQALAAGNAVLWKPAPGTAAPAKAMRDILVAAGLDPLLLQVLPDTSEAATEAIRNGVDKVILTGSVATGRAVLHELAETLTPAVMELSGCDAVFVLDDADLDHAAAAIAFGLRLNGSATCMAPRRLFASPSTAQRLQQKLIPLLKAIEPVTLPAQTARRLDELLAAAKQDGAQIASGRMGGSLMRPMLITGATEHMLLTQTDIAVPLLSIIEVSDENAALAAYAACPYALTAAVFGPENKATKLAARIHAGVVLINDIIASTADPRAPFGGRGASGFGVTRGREGLLEMTAIKTVLIQRSRDLKPYQPTGNAHSELFLSYIRMVHTRGWRARFEGLLQLCKAVMTLGRSSPRK